MKTLLTGPCHRDNIFTLVDPTSFSEAEFEAEVHRALHCLMPEYHCRVFSGAFVHEGETRKPDIVLVHRTLSHWFVVEVELVGHSLEGHVLPQLRCFRFGYPHPTCTTSLHSAIPELSREQAQTLLDTVPYSAICIANIRDPEWAATFRGLDVELLVLSVYEGQERRRAYELEGKLSIRQESLGFAQYFATHSAIRVPKSIPLPTGYLQIIDQFGTMTEWTVIDDSEFLWMSKNDGAALIPHQAWVQIIRNVGGRLAIKVPT